MLSIILMVITMVKFLTTLGGDYGLKEIILFSVFSSGYLMFFVLRMSIKQAIFVWLHVFLTALSICILVSKNEGVILTAIGTFLAIVINLVFYWLKHKKDGLKFDEPFFEKGYLKMIINGIHEICKENKK